LNGKQAGKRASKKSGTKLKIKFKNGDAMVMLMIDKGHFTKDEYFTKLKEVQGEYKSKNGG